MYGKKKYKTKNKVFFSHTSVHFLRSKMKQTTEIKLHELEWEFQWLFGKVCYSPPPPSFFFYLEGNDLFLV